MPVKLKGISTVDGRTVEVKASDIDGGGDGAGSVLKLVKFEFAFDTPNMHLGIPIYTPKVGDILYDMWFEVVTAFNFFAVNADVSVEPATQGLFTNIYAPYNLADDPVPINGLRNDNQSGRSSLIGLAQYNRGSPASFISTDPLKLYVTANGLCDGTGDPIACTAGEASVHLLVIPAS